MSKKVFLDVGGHIGQTLQEVVRPYYGFDKIYCFEPCKTNYDKVVQMFDACTNVVVHNFGLSNASRTLVLYDPGSIGASVFSDKCDIDNAKTETVTLQSASEWINANLNVNEDVIFMKLNCEGSECDIVDDLIKHDIFDKINHIMIDFDVSKIPSQKHRELEIMSAVKNKPNIDRCENVMVGKTHGLRIRNWLDTHKCANYYVEHHITKVGACNDIICAHATTPDDVTVVITCCNRPDLLRITLESFVRFNTYPIDKFVIIEDSGEQGINDFARDIIDSNIEVVLIYNDKNVGQIKSIDKAYAHVHTKYIFHLEEDWEFYKSGFIEQSMEILQADKTIVNVWLIEYTNHKAVFSNHVIEPTVYNNKYKLLSNNHKGIKRRTPKSKKEEVIWMGFTFNPGLRRLGDYNLVKPFTDSCMPYFFGKQCDELDIQKLYKNLGFKAAITLENGGFVRHIGYGTHVRRAWE